MQPRRVADHDAGPPREIVLLHRIELVSAMRGLAHDRVSRVLVDLELVERIDDERHLHHG